MHAIKWNESKCCWALRCGMRVQSNSHVASTATANRRVCVKNWIFGIQFKLCRTTRSSCRTSHAFDGSHSDKIIKSFVILVAKNSHDSSKKKHKIAFAINFMRTLFFLDRRCVGDKSRRRWQNERQNIFTEFYLCEEYMYGVLTAYCL